MRKIACARAGASGVAGQCSTDTRRAPSLDPDTMRSFAVACAMLLLLTVHPVHAQRVSLDSVSINDSTTVYALTLRDGSKVIGRVMHVTADSVRMQSTSAVTMLSRAAIVEVRAYPASSMHNGALWSENPHATRLLFSPTAIPLRKGESYFADFWVFVLSAATGITDRFTLGGGMTLIPGLSIQDNVFYALPKYTVVDLPTTKIALGGLLAIVPLSGTTTKSVGVLYGVGTLGSREHNATVGAGWGYVGGTLSNKPVLTLGGQTRVTRRMALISENWFVPIDGKTFGFVSYGVRFIGEKIAVKALNRMLEIGRPISARVA